MMNKRSTHESLLIVSDLVAIGVSVFIVYKMVAKSDTSKTLAMEGMTLLSKFARGQAEQWGRLAIRSETKYWQLANVTA
jgi:hypothetical protein